ncbi:MAG TPA: glutamate-1-semialdehyde 2,1-aminomutase [Phycisphaerae bacterium]|nr:glutamate-1-semialdehyde 2,1-aminomutase [Phycisphaerae bacterium]
MPDRTDTQSTEKSKAAYQAACRLMPGGVNSPVRAFGAVGGTPRFIAKGAGAVLTDIDGNDYIDYVGSWGPLILGHGDERVEAAVCKAAAKGCSFGAPTELEVQLAELVISRVPSVERVRFVNSGTEATMSAVRLARGFTGRHKVVKCEGCYHGHVDALLVQAGSGAMTLGTPSSPGVPPGTTADTLLMPYNDPEAAATIFKKSGDQIAAVLIEPIAGNMGCVPPKEGYLEALRELCDRHDALLIFDEVMTGFRVSPGGAQELFGIRPDLTCLGKILGGGLPVAAYGGRQDIMEKVSPAGPVYQAGTLSGNPLAMAAGVATLQALGEPDLYGQLDERAAQLADGIGAAAEKAGLPIYQTRVGSMGCVFFSEQPVTDFPSASKCDTQRYARYFHAMLERGVYLAPSQFECYFVSTAHTAEQVEQTVSAAAESFAQIMEGNEGG